MTPAFESILVANRGEIAVRIIESARRLGYRTIAIYSDADASAPHVRLADDSIRIGPAPVAESYLDPERILTAAKERGAGAIHPGYGFLSENAEFARACQDAGLCFIGPEPDAIALMGNKAAAKRRMIDAGVPCVPGYEGTDQSDAAFSEAAAKIAYPIMVKAAAGGGGRGMRLVAGPDELRAALQLARSESLGAFGSDELILERAIVRPRHVEVQVFADHHGNVIHLGERDCSVQRRHQKVIEEAPCPIMTAELRQSMGQAAVDAARSIDYRGAGTVEFLLDQRGEFYFLEMNTRLQVEHPVTEMITGLDLVALQIEVARGAPLPLGQDEVRFNGHAIEVRLYAEDPANDFMPATGNIALWIPPAADGIRVDAGIETGLEVSSWYDPLLAKIIAWGDTRENALERLSAALGNTVLFGPKTNRDFLIGVLGNETFTSGKATTALIAEDIDLTGFIERQTPAELAAVAAVLSCRESAAEALAASVRVAPELLNWSSAGRLTSRFALKSGNQAFDLRVSPMGGDGYRVSAGNEVIDIVVHGFDGQSATVGVNGKRVPVHAHVADPRRLYIATDTRSAVLSAANGADDTSEAQSGGRVIAPMHGQLLELCVSKGDTIEKGARLAVLEAMKMQHEILAHTGGVVSAVHCEPGNQVAAAALLLEIEQTN